MTPPNPLTELAERCEKLTGPCRETDALIWWHTSRKSAERVYWNAATGLPKPLGDALPDGLGKIAVKMNSPEFTESLDAAESLAPDNTEIIQYWILGKKPCVSARRDEWHVTVNAETKVGALLSALLRARAASESPHG